MSEESKPREEGSKSSGLVVDGRLAGYLLVALIGLAGGGGLGTAVSKDDTSSKIEATTERVTILIAEVKSLRTELASELKYQSQQDASLDRGLKEIRTELRSHTRLPWHREAGAEHAETKRRVTRLEQEVAELRAAFRERRKAEDK